MKYDAAELGIAVILCARKAVGMDSVWNHRMDELTTCLYEQVAPCYAALWESYQEELEFCIKEKERIMDLLPTKGLPKESIERETEKEETSTMPTRKAEEEFENVRPVLQPTLLKENRAASPIQAYEKVAEARARDVQALKVRQFGEPLRVSQRLNISG